MPNIRIPKQVTPSAEEDELPPGRYTIPTSIEVGDVLTTEIVCRRTGYLWTCASNGIWARVCAKPDMLGLVNLGGPLVEFTVVEVRDKYVVLDGDDIVPDSSNPDPEAAKSESEEEWDVPPVQTGDRFAAIVNMWIVLPRKYG